ncbi:CBN-ARRD-19 protein [Caenorhabditis brenneri]|uniref:CBN-ARRD-19 protein n=1 Tax=Caenorhabditis brenneri TaxID=135651 RepID=G0MQE0_CAEBE|nr:CBN-ARRD-19 protein [Caenorhabditis brenneri]
MPDTELLVEFDQPQEVFFPGQPISGRVILITEEKYKARAVNIKFEGCAKTDWDDHESVRRVDAEGKAHYVQQRVNYSANVKYLESTALLWACRDGTNELAAGKYVWPFSYNLPANIPPSFEGKYGYIRYSVTAEVDRPWRFDKAKKRCITVSPLLDLNILPHAMTPLHDEASDTVGCCCFKKGYLEMRVDIPKTGFVPGETVPINLHILNHSSVPVTEVKAKILQQCKFVAFRHGNTFDFTGESLMAHSAREQKQDMNAVIKQTQALTVAPSNEHKLALELRLPSVTPTINQNSPIITVEYLVQISVDTTSTFSSDIDCEMSVLIGTVPIRQYLPPAYYPPNPALPPVMPTPMPPQIGGGVAPPPGYGFVPPQPEGSVPMNAPPYPGVGGGAEPLPSKGDAVVIPSAPPLSYQDSMYGTGGTQLNTDENEKPFVPKYPVFNDLPVYNPSAPPPE